MGPPGVNFCVVPPPLPSSPVCVIVLHAARVHRCRVCPVRQRVGHGWSDRQVNKPSVSMCSQKQRSARGAEGASR